MNQFQYLIGLAPTGHVNLFYVIPFFVALAIWSIVIKGIALWKSAKNDHHWWFIVLLVVNSLGILELIYLVWFGKEKGRVAQPPAPAPVSEPRM